MEGEKAIPVVVLEDDIYLKRIDFRRLHAKGQRRQRRKDFTKNLCALFLNLAPLRET